jgi:hypothetical protein
MTVAFNFNAMFPNATNAQKWEQIRMWRNQQLRDCDWTQLPDAPVNASLWANYRQKLRHIDDTQSADDYEPPMQPTD